MNASVTLRAVGYIALGGLWLADTVAQAAPTWGIDPNSATLQIDADAYADNGVNGFRPLPGIWYQDMDSATIADVQSDLMASFFGQPAETYDLGAAVNLFGTDAGGPNPFFSTLASTVGVVAIDGVGTRTLSIYWRANTANEQNGIGGEGFLSDSMADITAQIVATIEGVAPGTSVNISYEWEYLGIAVIDHEGAGEDPTSASGTLGFVDEQGTGPGNLFAQLFAEPGPLNGSNSGNGSYDLTTSNTSDPSFVTVDLDGFSSTIMAAPGDPALDPVQRDLASSVFNGRLTLTLPIPEPSSLMLLVIALAAFGSRRRRA